MATPAGYKGCLNMGSLQDLTTLTTLILPLLLVSMVPVVNSQVTQPAYIHTTNRGTAGYTAYRATTVIGSSPKLTYPPPTGNTGHTQATPSLPYTGPATAAAPPTTAIPSGPVVGNLTGENVCFRPKVDHRYNWKHITFACDRKEYVPCWSCVSCKRENSTHCAKTLQGDCTADVYQYEPVTIHVTVCCDGYQQEGNVCVESVQCKDNNGGCQHICRSNKVAGFHCECFAGYQLNGSKCEDYDECSLQNGACSDLCINTVGSYYCKCDAGRQLASPFRCEDLNPCVSIESSGCDHACVRADQGRYYCECRDGYQLYEGHKCNDINECDLSYNPCSHMCENFDGGFKCRCPQDQVLKLDNKTCIFLGRTDPNGVAGVADDKKTTGILATPAMIGGLAALGALLLLVSCVWIICCYVRGICCCQESTANTPRHRRQKPEDVQAIVVQYSNRNKEEESQNGFNNSNYESYNNQPVDEYNTHARTPNGLSTKEEIDGDIHIIPDFAQSGGGGGRSEVSVPNGYNNRRQGVALPGLT